MTQVDQEYVDTLIHGLEAPPDILIGGSVSDRLDMAVTIAQGRDQIHLDMREVGEQVLGKELWGT